MAWKRVLVSRLNAVLQRATGYELRASAGPRGQPAEPRDVRAVSSMPPEQRLLRAPVFIISSVRSGSTLLRVILGSHSQLHAPHELHLSRIGVRLGSRNARNAMAAIDLDEAALEHLLWDRLLDRQLRSSGKKILVNKTPSDAFICRRIAQAWPDARFIFLLRHPLAIARSHQAGHGNKPLEFHIGRAMRFMTAVDEARQELPGLTVRYEQLTAQPDAVTKEICAFLGVPWEPGMLDYGSSSEEGFRKGLGDWTDRIRSGSVQPARPLPAPEEVPASLQQLSRAWGYLPAD